jgi:GNAT superfamily N-acetyltransferase
MSRYHVDPKTNRAEVAFVVRDDWQNRGIGSFLLKSLTSIAKNNGASGFTAEVLRNNKARQAVLDKSEAKVSTKLQQNVYRYRRDFA